MAHWTQVSDHCPLGYLFPNVISKGNSRQILILKMRGSYLGLCVNCCDCNLKWSIKKTKKDSGSSRHPWGTLVLSSYTPSIYVEGYIVFVLPCICSYVRSYIRSFVHPSVVLVEFRAKFYVKVSQVGISHQPLIRKHSYLDHRYTGGSAFIPWLWPQGPCPRVRLGVKV